MSAVKDALHSLLDVAIEKAGDDLKLLGIIGDALHDVFDQIEATALASETIAKAQQK